MECVKKLLEENNKKLQLYNNSQINNTINTATSATTTSTED